MMASRGMGAMSPSKMPGGKKKARRDDTDFTQFDEGGEVEDATLPSDVKLGVQRPRLNLKQKEVSGRLTAEKQLGDNTSLQGYLDGGLNKRGPNVKGFGVNLTHRFAKGGAVKAAGGGLYANIAAKKKRIAEGSGEKMRSAGSAGAPKKSDFVDAAKTAKLAAGGLAQQAATAIAMKAKGVKPKKMAEGGKSTVNSAGNYTKPELRKRIFNAVKAEATAGTGAGEWSARKAQMVAQRYKKAGGGYRD